MRSFLLIGCALLLAVARVAGASTVDAEIGAGRAALANHDLATARTHFVAARAADPSNQTAAALLGITRWFALIGDAPAQAYMDSFGVSSTGRDVYAWTATLPQTPEGDIQPPEQFNLEDGRSFWVNTLVATAAAAQADLAAVTDHDFQLTLTAAEVGGPASVTLDLGDILMCRTALSTMQVFGNFLFGALHLDAELPQIAQLAEGNLLTLSRVLEEHPQLLVAGSLAQRQALRTALLDLVDSYRRASVFIRSRPAGAERLFMLEEQDLGAEAELRRDLGHLEQAITGYASLDGGRMLVSLTPLFTADWSLRDALPPMTGNRFDPFAIADTSFGGVVIGMPREEFAGMLTELGYVADLGWEPLHPLPVTQGFSAYVHAGTHHVVLGGAGRVGRSTDGVTGWTYQQVPGAQDFSGVAKIGSVLAAVAQTQIWISEDAGATWTQVVQSWRDWDGEQVGNFTDITATANGFVALTNRGYLWQSADGFDWTRSDMPIAYDVNLTGLAVGPSGFVVVGQSPAYYGTPAPAVFKSADGQNWNQVFAGTGNAPLRGVANAGDWWVAGGNAGLIAYSSDGGNTWQQSSSGVSSDIFFRTTYNEAAGGFVFSASGGRLAIVSGPGQLSYVTASDGTPSFFGLANGASGLYAVGSSGSIYRLTQGNTLQRVDANQSVLPRNAGLFAGVEFNGKLYFPVSSGGVLESSDGVTFVARATGVSASLNSLAVHNGRLYAAGALGTIVSTADGQSWQVHLHNNAQVTTAALLKIASVNSILIAGGSGGTVLTSPDGTEWTRRTTGQGAAVRSIAYGNGFYLLGLNATTSSGYTESAVLSSTDLVSWSRHYVMSSYFDSGGNPDVLWLNFQDGAFYAYLGNGVLLRTYGTPPNLWWDWLESDLGPVAGGTFTSDGHFMSVGRSGSDVGSAVYYTFDEGDAWVRAALPASGSFSPPVRFQNRLYVAGGGAAIYRSRVLPASRPGPLSADLPVLTAIEGGAIRLAAAVAGSEPMEYEWSFDGTTVARTASSSLWLEDVGAAQAGVYTLTATGAYSGASVQQTVTLGVTSSAPRITQQPLRQAISLGEPLTLQVAAAGSAPLSYQWYKDDELLAGRTAATLAISATALTDAGRYRVEVTNTAGTVRSLDAAVAVVPDLAAFWRVTDDPMAGGGYTPARTVHAANGTVYLVFSTTATAHDVRGASKTPKLLRFIEETGAVDPGFVWDASSGEPAYVAPQADGKVVVALRLGLGEGSVVIRANADGSRDGSFTPVYFARSIRFLKLQPDGKVLVVTDVSAALQPGPNAILTTGPALHRLLANGGVDPGFTAAVANATIFSEPLLDAAGNIYLAGGFRTINGTARYSVARVSSTGALDANFGNPFDPAWMPASFAQSSIARGFRLQSDGRIVAVGRFAYSGRGNISSDPVLAIRFNADGTFDSTFAQPLRSQTSIGQGDFTGQSGFYYLRAVAPADNDKFVAISDRLLRFNADGSVDDSFAAVPFGREAYWVSRSPSNGLYFVPDLNDEEGHGFVAVFAADGTPMGAGDQPEWGVVAAPSESQVLADGRLFLTGSFNRFRTERVPGAVLLTSAGDFIDEATEFHNPGEREPGQFTRVTGYGDGSFYVYRSYLQYNEVTQAQVPYVSDVERYNADGSMDGDWWQEVMQNNTSDLAAGPGGTLFAWMRDLPVDLPFNMEGNGNSWFRRYHSYGGRDYDFVPDYSALFAVERDANQNITNLRIGRVLGVSPLRGGRVLLLIASAAGDIRIIRLLPSGQRDASFTETVLATARQSTGTTPWSIYDPQTGSYQVRPVTTLNDSGTIGRWLVAPDGRIYVTGSLTVAGQPAGIVRLLANGQPDSSFTGTGLAYDNEHGLPAHGFELSVDDYGRLYLAGRFTSINGHAAAGLARFLANGALDTTWAPGIEVRGDSLTGTRLIGSRGTLHVLGSAAEPDAPLGAGYLRVALTPTSPVVLAQSPSRAVGLGNSVEIFANAFGGHEATIQWFKDGQPLAGENGRALQIDHFSQNDVGVYRLRITNALGSAESADIALTVGIPPVITQQPQDVGVAEGGTAVFSVTATDATSYQWYFYDSLIPGANTSTHTVNGASYQNSGPYRVVVSNVAGSVSSATVFLEIYSGLQAFTYEYFTPGERDNPAISGLYADPDGDGLANLLEYALGFHPRQVTAAGLPEAGKDNDSWTFTYTRPSDLYDVSYTVEASTDLAQWSNDNVWVEWLGESDGYALLRAHYPSNLATKVFFRLSVSPQMPTVH